jgi:WD40 repeat protein
MALSPRRDWLAVGETTGRLTLWPLNGGGRVPRVFHVARPEPLFPVRFSADGSTVAWGSSADGVSWLWDLDGPPDAAPAALRMSYGLLTTSGQFAPGDKWLTVASNWGLTFWAVGQRRVRIITAPSGRVFTLAFTPDSKALLSCAADDAVRRWPLDAQGVAAGPLAGTAGGCRDLAISADGQRLVRSGRGGVFVGPVAGGEERPLLRDVAGNQLVVALDPAGRYAAAAPAFHAGEAASRVLHVWDLATGADRVFPLVPPGEEPVDARDWGLLSIGFTESGAVVGGGARGVRIFDLHAGRSDWVWHLGLGHQVRLEVSGDGRFAVARVAPNDPSREEYQVALLDLRDRPRRMIHTHGDRVQFTGIDHSGSVIVTSDLSGAVRVGRSDDSEPHLLLGGAGMGPVAISPDGRWIASAHGSEIRLWPAPDLTRQPLHTLPAAVLLDRLRDLTNFQIVEGSSGSAYRVETGPFPGWKTPPTW